MKPLPFYLANYQCAADAGILAGIVIEGTVHDLGAALGMASFNSLTEVYGNWARVDAALRAGIKVPTGGLPIAEVQFLAPSLEPTSLYFAGFNYRDHVANMMKIFNLPDDPDPKAIGQKPWHNLKPRNCICGPGTIVKLPTARVDWEVELAVVIGRAARNITVEAALSYLAGYTIGIDLSARDRAFRPHAAVDSVARMDWIAQKGFEGACPLGPWLTPANRIADPQALNLSLSINGEMKQNSNTREMIFSVAEAVSHLSSMVTLSPGDIILTGTPAGTGAELGEALKPGDVIRANIQDIGELIIYTA